MMPIPIARVLGTDGSVQKSRLISNIFGNCSPDAYSIFFMNAILLYYSNLPITHH